ncbi:LacI family DNA-binding transcriptional regulator [Dokdonella sp.]|uniref:LacI family DNA-binding transcriptional regulator n=1 Tax=Dokdonella sp. TaxID=2291710 RepID=UPI002F419C6A
MAVTIKDVARAAGVSVASVSRALNGRDNVTDATRHRILEVATRLRYRPNDAARSLITKRTRTIGAVLPDLHGEFFSELIRGIDVAARARGFHVLVSSSHGDSDETSAAIRAMQGRVDGLLVMSPHVDATFLHESLPDALPVVLLNAPPDRSRFPALHLDNHGGALAMTRHLLSRGHRRIAMIGGPAGNLDADERRRGWLDALAEASLADDAPFFDGDFSEASGHAAGQRIAALAQRPDAVFAANDMMAVGCLIALGERGVRVPGDVALAGFDDVPIARYVSPQLTTVRVRIADLGRAAFERLVAELEAPGTRPVRAEVLPCEIVVRASCGRCPERTA